MTHKIKIETKCWERDWEILLKTNRIQKLIEYNNYPFSTISLLINNVNDIDKVKHYADKLIDRNILTEYIVVNDYADQALEFFNITKESLGKGYYYSIAELVGIYLSKDDYILHFSSDSFLNKKISWIDKAVKMLDENNKIANLVWNDKYHQAKDEAFNQDDDFYYSYGFSDQMYLIRTEDFNKPIYSEKHTKSERYPAYAGELFEKRIDSWIRNNKFNRVTYKHESYYHKNYYKSKLVTNFKIITGNYNIK